MIRRPRRAARQPRSFAAILTALPAVAVLTAALSLAAAAPASAVPQPVRACTASSGVIVAVDFTHFGGPLLRACGTTPTTSFTLLNQGGWHTTGTEHDGPGFVCRIGYAGFRHGRQYPAPAHEACVLTPPADSYWTSWHAGPGQDTWAYSPIGAVGYHPAPGSVDLWIFGGTNISGTSGSAVPVISPDSIRHASAGQPGGSTPAGTPPIVNARPILHNANPGPGSPTPTLITAGALLLVVAAGALVRRRTRRERA